MSCLYSPVDSAFGVSTVGYLLWGIYCGVSTVVYLLWCIYCCVPCRPLVVSENCWQCPCSSVCCSPPGILLSRGFCLSSHFTRSMSLYVSVVMTTGQRLSGSLDWHHNVVLLSSVTRSVACPVLSQLPLCLPSPRTCFLASTPHLLVVLAKVPQSPFLTQGALKTHVNAEFVLSHTPIFLKSHRHTKFICGHRHDSKHTLPGGEGPLYSDPEQNHPDRPSSHNDRSML